VEGIARGTIGALSAIEDYALQRDEMRRERRSIEERATLSEELLAFEEGLDRSDPTSLPEQYELGSQKIIDAARARVADDPALANNVLGVSSTMQAHGRARTLELSSALHDKDMVIQANRSLETLRQQALFGVEERNFAEQQAVDIIDMLPGRTDEQKAAVLEDWLSSVDTTVVGQILEGVQDGTITAADGKSMLLDEESLPSLTPEQRDKAVGEVDAVLNAAHAKRISDAAFQFQLDARYMSPADVEATAIKFRELGGLTDAKAISIIEEARDREDTAKTSAEAITWVAGALAKNRAPLFSDDNYQKAVQTTWDSQWQPLADEFGSTQEYIGVGMEFTARAQVWPDTFKTRLESALNNGSNDEQVFAAKEISELAVRSPRLYSQLSDFDKVRASNLTTFAMGDDTKAVERTEMVMGVDKSTGEIRQSRYDDFVTKNPTEAYLRKNAEKVPGWQGYTTWPFGSKVEDLPPKALADFEELSRKYSFWLNGDHEEARRLALMDWSDTYHPDDSGPKSRFIAGGPQSPRNYGSGDLSFDEKWMKGDLILEARPFLPPEMEGLSDEELEGRVFWEVDADARASIAPRFTAMFIDNDGRLGVLPFRWAPDRFTSPTLKKIVGEDAVSREDVRFWRDTAVAVADPSRNPIVAIHKILSEQGERERASLTPQQRASRERMGAFWGGIAAGTLEKVGKVGRGAALISPSSGDRSLGAFGAGPTRPPTTQELVDAGDRIAVFLEKNLSEPVNEAFGQ
jgi:hypothetical protein